MDRLIILTLALTPLVYCVPPPPTLKYWIHESCRHYDLHFQNAFDDFQTMARRAAERMMTPEDTLMSKRYFQLLFMERPAVNNDAAKVTRVFNTLGQPQLGISSWIQENDRRKADYRFYCDNDRRAVKQNPWSKTRWQLRKDPTTHPAGYVVQDKRPIQVLRLPGGINVPVSDEWNNMDIRVYQEYEDLDNGILMGGTRTCGEPGVQAAIYTTQIPAYGDRKYGDQPPHRATITVCDKQLEQIQGLRVIPDGADFTAIAPGPGGSAAINRFRDLTSFILLRAALLLPQYGVIDEYIGEDERAWGWENAINLQPYKKPTNAENYAFFGLLASLADRGWRIGDGISKQKKGKLIKDEAAISGHVPALQP